MRGSIQTRKEFDQAVLRLQELQKIIVNLETKLNYLEQMVHCEAVMDEIISCEKKLCCAKTEIEDLRYVFYSIRSSVDKPAADSLGYDYFLSSVLHSKWLSFGYSSIISFADFLGEVGLYMSLHRAETFSLSEVDYYTYLITKLRSHDDIGRCIIRHWDDAVRDSKGNRCAVEKVDFDTMDDIFDCRQFYPEDEDDSKKPVIKNGMNALVLQPPRGFEENVLSKMAIVDLGKENGISVDMMQVLIMLSGSKVTQEFTDMCNREIFIPEGKFYTMKELQNKIHNIRRRCQYKGTMREELLSY